MNPLNYASPEASRRLIDAEIVLETEAVWVWPEYKASGICSTNPDNVMPYLSPRCCREVENGGKFLPAPSMQEAWRELPVGMIIENRAPFHEAMRMSDSEPGTCIDINPTDALVDLLIWMRKER